MSADRGADRPTRREPPDRDARDGRGPLGRDRPAVEDRDRHARRAGRSARRGRGSPAVRVPLFAGSRRPTSSRAGRRRRRRRRPRRSAGIAWPNEPGRSRVDADLRWQLGVARRARPSPVSASSSRSSSGGIAAIDVGGAQVAQRRDGRSPSHRGAARSASARRADAAYDPTMAPDRRRAEPRQPEARARRDRPVRRARRIEKDPAVPARSDRIAANERATPRSGRPSCATRRGRAAGSTAPRSARPASSS